MSQRSYVLSCALVAAIGGLLFGFDTAVIAMGLLAGCELNALVAHACRVAAYVCSRDRAVPPLPSDLRRLP